MQTEDWELLRYHHAANHVATTINLARQFVADYPECGPAWQTLGSRLIDVARYDEAKAALEEAIKFCSDDKLWIPYCEMGHLYKAKGNYNLASAWYHSACVLCPLEASPHVYLGGIFAKMGEFSNAEAKHRDAIACKTGCIDEAWLNLGLVLRAQEKYTEAAEAFREAINLDPNYELAKTALEDVLNLLPETS